jgi:hypothetical protein
MFSPPELGPPPGIINPVDFEVLQRTYGFLSHYGCEHFLDRVNENHDFFPDVTPKILSSKPKRTPVTKAEIAAYQVYTDSRKTKWLRAQCGFRELLMGGGKSKLQGRLRKYGAKGLGPRVLRAAKRARKEYRRENEEKLREFWREADDELKVSFWPKKFLYETLFLADPGNKKPAAIGFYLEKGAAENLEKAAGEMGLLFETIIVLCGDDLDAKRFTACKQVVVGTDRKSIVERSAARKEERRSEHTMLKGDTETREAEEAR